MGRGGTGPGDETRLMGRRGEERGDEGTRGDEGSFIGKGEERGVTGLSSREASRASMKASRLARSLSFLDLRSRLERRRWRSRTMSMELWEGLLWWSLSGLLLLLLLLLLWSLSVRNRRIWSLCLPSSSRERPSVQSSWEIGEFAMAQV